MQQQQQHAQQHPQQHLDLSGLSPIEAGRIQSQSQPQSQMTNNGMYYRVVTHFQDQLQLNERHMDDKFKSMEEVIKTLTTELEAVKEAAATKRKMKVPTEVSKMVRMSYQALEKKEKLWRVTENFCSPHNETINLSIKEFVDESSIGGQYDQCVVRKAINRYFESRKKLYTMMLDKSYEEIKAQNRRRARKHQTFSNRAKYVLEEELVLWTSFRAGDMSDEVTDEDEGKIKCTTPSSRPSHLRRLILDLDERRNRLSKRPVPRLY